MAEPHSILARVADGLRRRDWGAIGIEFLIVFVGVLLGTQVSNWNEERKDRAEVAGLFARLKPDIEEGAARAPALTDYYRSRRALGEKAERLLSETGHDLDLVTSARLASNYVTTMTFDRDTYVMKLGSDTVGKIPSGALRNALAELIQLRNDPYISYSYLDTDFRRLVLGLYPSAITEKISRACNLNGRGIPTIAELRSISNTECEVDLPAAEVARLAAALRADPRTLPLLRDHINRLRVAGYRIEGLEDANRAVLAAMGDKTAKPTPA